MVASSSKAMRLYLLHVCGCFCFLSVPWWFLMVSSCYVLVPSRFLLGRGLVSGWLYVGVVLFMAVHVGSMLVQLAHWVPFGAMTFPCHCVCWFAFVSLLGLCCHNGSLGYLVSFEIISGYSCWFHFSIMLVSLGTYCGRIWGVL